MNFKVLHRIGENLSAVITGRKQFYLLVDVEYLLGSQTWILITYYLIKNVQSSQWLDSRSNMYRDLVRNGLPEQTTLRDPQESECLLKPLKLMPYLFNSLWLLGSKFKKKMEERSICGMLKAKLAMDQTQNPSLCLLLLQPT